MSRKIGYTSLVALAFAGTMALSAAPASAQHYRNGGGYGARGYYGGGYYRGPSAGAVVGGTLLGLGILGGALALTAPPPPVYAPAPVYVPPPAYAPQPSYYYGYK
jgi:hypothetical protein